MKKILLMILLVLTITLTGCVEEVDNGLGDGYVSVRYALYDGRQIWVFDSENYSSYDSLLHGDFDGFDRTIYIYKSIEIIPFFQLLNSQKIPLYVTDKLFNFVKAEDIKIT